MPSVFAGGEDISFTKFGTPVVSTSAILRDTDFARCALHGEVARYWIADNWASALGAGSCRASLALAGISTMPPGNVVAELRSGATPVIRVIGGSSNGTLLLQRWNGATWVAVGTQTPPLATNTAYALAIQWDLSVSGSVSATLNGAVIGAYSGDMTATGVATLNALALRGTLSLGNGVLWSEVIVADEDCSTWRLKTLAPTGAGTYSEQSSGTFADVAETVASDVDLVALAADGDRFSVAVTDVAAIAGGLAVESVHAHARARNDGAGPLSVELGVRGNATDAYAASQPLSTGYGTVKARFTTLPGSANPPTPAQVDSYELIVRADA